MQKRKLIEQSSNQSHNLLHNISNVLDVTNPIIDVRSNKTNDRYRIFNQRLHNNSKISTIQPIQSINKCLVKESELLKKQNNKIQENISHHQIDQITNNQHQINYNHKQNLRNAQFLIDQFYFIPKTRQEILNKHRNSDYKSTLSHKTNKHLSNLSIKSFNQPSSTKNLHKKSKSRFNSLHSTPIESIDHFFYNSSKIPIKTNKLIENQKSMIQMESLFSKQKQNRISLSLIKKSNKFLPKQSQESFCKISKKATQISGFTQHELFGYYKSLLTFSKDSFTRYMIGFQTMLNLMNIATNENTVKQLLTNYFNKPSFHSFMDVFEQIIQCSLKESVVDYFEIVLDGKWTRELSNDQLTHLLSERMTSCHAKEIVQEIYYNLQKNNNNKITVQEIVQLCYENQQFCSFMRGYCQQTRRINKKIILPF